MKTGEPGASMKVIRDILAVIDKIVNFCEFLFLQDSTKLISPCTEYAQC